MERKKILRRAALIGVAVFLVAAAAAGAMALKVQRMDVRHRALADEQMAQLAKEYQGYLDETAKAIKGLRLSAVMGPKLRIRGVEYAQPPWCVLPQHTINFVKVPSSRCGACGVACHNNLQQWIGA